MSSIVLTAAVRQNLLSLQGTADLLAQTQTRLATGKKVNSALDNPTNFFTAAGLDARASDINNLLDSIGNGVQVLQAANTGITSLSSLVDTAKSIANQVLQQPSGYSTRANVAFTGANTSGTGSASTTNLNQGALTGEVFTFSTTTGSVAITLGPTNQDAAFDPKTNTATVTSLTDFNTALAAAGISLQASLSATDTLTFTSTSDGASQAITVNTGTPTAANTVDITAATATPGTVNPAVADPVSQATRANLVAQYNQILQQITTTAQDSSFNGINLLNGDSLKLVFDETGKSTVNIAGVTFDPTGLGLKTLTAGTDFIDGNSTNNVLTALNTASITLRSQASAFGANLSVIQIRQDFNKNLINVLQTGSANLTLADSNEEAANSQALSTRQAIATSALALANQSQQAVLQLLR
jgi:flagellin-like hook-associated protein FlgL